LKKVGFALICVFSVVLWDGKLVKRSSLKNRVWRAGYGHTGNSSYSGERDFIGRGKKLDLEKGGIVIGCFIRKKTGV